MVLYLSGGWFSELGGVGALELQLQLVGDEGDEFRVGGLAFRVADGVAEEALEGVQVAPVPGHLNGMADGALDSLEGVVWNVFATWGYNTFVMALMTSISLTAMMMASRRYW